MVFERKWKKRVMEGYRNKGLVGRVEGKGADCRGLAQPYGEARLRGGNDV